MNLDALKLLQTRIREAKGAHRELDAHIAAAFHGGRAYYAPAGYKNYEWVRRTTDDDHNGGVNFEAADYTADPDGLGACVALMREVLPGWRFDIRQQHQDDFQARVFRRALKRTCHDDIFANHRIATHALLLAIIAAKISEEESSTLTASENEKRE